DNNQAFFAEAKGRTRIPYGISAEAIQEFQVGASNFSAQYGRAAGGVIDAVTKSGTNDLHGSFFYLIRDDALNAENSTAKAQGMPKAQDRWQQFGPSIGGALQKNRLFYFLSYDQQTREFPAGVVPNSATFLSSPCTAPGCSDVVAFYHSLQGPQDRQGNQWLGLSRIDWNATERNQVSATVNILRWDSPNGIYAAPTHNFHASANGTDAVKNETVIARWNSLVRANFASELRFGWGRDLEQQAPNAAGPYVTITNGIDFGMAPFLPRAAYPAERRWQIAHNLSWLRGRHSFKFGYDVNFIRDKITNLFQGGGVYSYSTLNDFALDCMNPSLPLGDCQSTPTVGPQGLTGRHYTQFVQAFDTLGRAGTTRFSNRDYGFYFEDSFRPVSNFLVTLGLRYELETMPAPDAPNPALVATSRINTDWSNLGPRVGFSWNPFQDQKTVIRAGAGMYYGRTQNGTISSLLRENGQRLESYQFLPGSFRAPLFPQVLSAAPEALSGTPDSFFAARDFVNPLTYQLQFTIERELFRNFVLSGGYLGTRGQRFPLFRDINLSPTVYDAVYAVCAVPQAGSSAICPRVERIVSVPFFPGPAGNRPNPNFGRITAAESVVNTWYNGFVLQAQHRFTRGFFLQAALTLSKAQDNDQIQQAFFAPNQPLNPFQVRDDYSLSNLDQRKRFTLAAYWAPPLHRLGYRPLRAALDGFRLSTVVTLADGRPYSPEVSGNPSPMGVSTGILGVGGSTRVPWLGRNIYTTPGLATTDLRLSRQIGITDRLKLDLIAEAFNLFNRVNVTGINTTAYNVRGATLFPNSAFASPSATGNNLTRERQLQFGCRFTF
ncbi:MAG: TonB-dependent receptor, partial [Acidobacteria bacterium]|nr:TonB-dependent receptor [Acidobacteriota bacterium]